MSDCRAERTIRMWGSRVQALLSLHFWCGENLKGVLEQAWAQGSPKHPKRYRSVGVLFCWRWEFWGECPVGLQTVCTAELCSWGVPLHTLCGVTHSPTWVGDTEQPRAGQRDAFFCRQLGFKAGGNQPHAPWRFTEVTWEHAELSLKLRAVDRWAHQ